MSDVFSIIAYRSEATEKTWTFLKTRISDDSKNVRLQSRIFQIYAKFLHLIKALFVNLNFD